MGHYCWCCDRHRANERFSGRGHRDHICRDCKPLPLEERQYRSDIRNIQRCITPLGFIRKKRRKAFDLYLEHDNPAVCEYANQRLEDHRQLAEPRRRLSEDEEQFFDEEIPF